MPQGTLNISQTNQGTYVVKVCYEKKGKQKQITVQNSGITDMDLNGKTIEFERDNNAQIAKIICDGKEIFSAITDNTVSSPKQQQHYQKKTNHSNQQRNRRNYPRKPSQQKQYSPHSPQDEKAANAPYNFVPLNEIVVEAEPIPPFNTYSHENPKRYTGWIKLRIETKTPLYIRDTLTQKEMEKQAKIEGENKRNNTKKRYINSDFFSPGGKLKIPGSSLRGMVRNLVEIVSFGKFGAYDDKRLYFRSFADSAAPSLQKDYVENMIERLYDEKNHVYFAIKPVAGYLRKTRANHFVIVPAIEDENKTTFYKVEESKLLSSTAFKKIYPEKMSKGRGPNRYYKFLDHPVIFQGEPPRKHGISYWGEVQEIGVKKQEQDNTSWQNGWLICTGWMNKKHLHWVINSPNHRSKPLQIDEELLQSYKDDVNRHEEANLLKKLEKNPQKYPDGIPCFYICNEQGEIISFGHTGMFRLAYQKTIGQHIPEKLKDENKCDIVGAIFGNENTFAGRVFFEDALLQDGQNSADVLTGDRVPKNLSSPKPTTFQHYLEQTEKPAQDLDHYNSETPIRGNKLYWHKSGEHWLEDANKQEQLPQKILQGKETQHTLINAVKSGTSFTGRIRFENLSEIELGALLFCLDLPDDCLHKLGMGKPLGLGSVKITPTLHLSDRVKRYMNLFTEWEENSTKSENLNRFEKAFEEYVIDKIAPSMQDKNLWKTERLQELKYMLNYGIGIKLEKQEQTRYMKIQKIIPDRKPENEFRKRPILPQPSEVAKRVTLY